MKGINEELHEVGRSGCCLLDEAVKGYGLVDFLVGELRDGGCWRVRWLTEEVKEIVFFSFVFSVFLRILYFFLFFFSFSFFYYFFFLYLLWFPFDLIFLLCLFPFLFIFLFFPFSFLPFSLPSLFRFLSFFHYYFFFRSVYGAGRVSRWGPVFCPSPLWRREVFFLL